MDNYQRTTAKAIEGMSLPMAPDADLRKAAIIREGKRALTAGLKTLAANADRLKDYGCRDAAHRALDSLNFSLEKEAEKALKAQARIKDDFLPYEVISDQFDIFAENQMTGARIKLHNSFDPARAIKVRDIVRHRMSIAEGLRSGRLVAAASNVVAHERQVPSGMTMVQEHTRTTYQVARALS